MTSANFSLDLMNCIEKSGSLDLSAAIPVHAVVGLRLRGSTLQDLELLFIHRAEQERDPWSGQIGFPGGRAHQDESFEQTLYREYQEELGLPLQPDTKLVPLDDIRARKSGVLLPFFVRPFVFFGVFFGQGESFQVDKNEVQSTHWVRVMDLLDPKNQTILEWSREGRQIQMPGVKFDDKRVLWGLSYLIVEDLLSRLKAGGILSSIEGWREVRSRVKEVQ